MQLLFWIALSFGKKEEPVPGTPCGGVCADPSAPECQTSARTCSPCRQSGTVSIPDITYSAEENVEGGINWNDGSDLEFVWDGISKQLVGITFPTVDIAPGSTVESAFILFELDEIRPGQTDAPMSVLIYGDAVVNSEKPSGVNYDFADRKQTDTQVEWAPRMYNSGCPGFACTGIDGDDLETANIGPVIQEIIELDGWVSGNPITILFKDDHNNPTLRTTSRWVEAYSVRSTGITTPALSWTFSSCSSCGKGNFLSKGTCSPCPSDTYQDAEAHTETACKPQPTCGAGEVLLVSDENEVGECTKLNCDPLHLSAFGDHVVGSASGFKGVEPCQDLQVLPRITDFKPKKQCSVECMAGYTSRSHNKPGIVICSLGPRKLWIDYSDGAGDVEDVRQLDCQADPCIATDDPDTVSQTEKYCGDGLVVSGTTGTCGCVGAEDVASFGYAAPSSGNSGYAAYAVTILVFSICMVLFGLLLMFK
jgi:hypothetical protein